VAVGPAACGGRQQRPWRRAMYCVGSGARGYERVGSRREARV
jgi:hypothetical protein